MRSERRVGAQSSSQGEAVGTPVGSLAASARGEKRVGRRRRSARGRGSERVRAGCWDAMHVDAREPRAALAPRTPESRRTARGGTPRAERSWLSSFWFLVFVAVLALGCWLLFPAEAWSTGGGSLFLLQLTCLVITGLENLRRAVR